MSKTYSKRQKQVRKQRWYNPDNDPHKRFVANQEEYKACAKKTGAYRYESEALAHAQHFNARSEHRDELVWTTYECPFCKKWHLTTNTTPSIRKQRLAEKYGRAE